jgi:hypothetical protein
MPMDQRGTKHWQQANVDKAADIETIILFGGNIGEFSRKEVEALREVVADESFRPIERQNALEKLQRWSDQGSKFAQSALKDLGLGSAAMSNAEFERAIANMRLDDKGKARVRSFGKGFFRFASALANPKTQEDMLNLADLAQRSGPEAAASFVAGANDSAIEAINREFTLANPAYFLCDDNFDAIVNCLSLRYLGYDSENSDASKLMNDLFCDGHWTAENLQAAYEELNAAGALKVAPGKAKPIAADDRQALSIAAAAITTENDLSRVLNAYLQFSLGDDAPRHWKQVVGQVRYAGVLFDAVMFAWSHKRADYLPSEGAEAYLKQYLSGRFPSFPLLDAAWERCKSETNGRGNLSPEDSVVEEETVHEDATLADINARYTVRN